MHRKNVVKFFWSRCQICKRAAIIKLHSQHLLPYEYTKYSERIAISRTYVSGLFVDGLVSVWWLACLSLSFLPWLLHSTASKWLYDCELFSIMTHFSLGFEIYCIARIINCNSGMNVSFSGWHSIYSYFSIQSVRCCSSVIKFFLANFCMVNWSKP